MFFIKFITIKSFSIWLILAIVSSCNLSSNSANDQSQTDKNLDEKSKKVTESKQEDEPEKPSQDLDQKTIIDDLVDNKSTQDNQDNKSTQDNQDKPGGIFSDLITGIFSKKQIKLSSKGCQEVMYAFDSIASNNIYYNVDYGVNSSNYNNVLSNNIFYTLVEMFDPLRLSFFAR